MIARVARYVQADVATLADDVGLYITGEPGEKIARLQSEGVTVMDGRASMSNLFTEFVGPSPPRRLREQQARLQQLVQPSPPKRPVRTVPGLDVPYVSPDFAAAAYCTL